MDKTEPTKSDKGKPTKTERGNGRYKLLLVFNPFTWPYYSVRYAYKQSSGFSTYATVILIVAGVSGALVATVVVATALGLIPLYIAAAGGAAGGAAAGGGGAGGGAGVASKLVTVEGVAMFELDTSVVNLNDFSNGNQFGVKTAEIEKSVSFRSFFEFFFEF